MRIDFTPKTMSFLQLALFFIGLAFIYVGSNLLVAIGIYFLLVGWNVSTRRVDE